MLVVDDHEDQARSTAAALRAIGLRVESISDGAGALRAIEDRPIDICIVDLVMPGMSGAEVVERLRWSRTDITAIVVIRPDQHGDKTDLAVFERPRVPEAQLQ